MESEIEPLRLVAEQGSEVCAHLNEQINELAAQLYHNNEGQGIHPPAAALDVSHVESSHFDGRRGGPSAELREGAEEDRDSNQQYISAGFSRGHTIRSPSRPMMPSSGLQAAYQHETRSDEGQEERSHTLTAAPSSSRGQPGVCVPAAVTQRVKVPAERSGNLGFSLNSFGSIHEVDNERSIPFRSNPTFQPSLDMASLDHQPPPASSPLVLRDVQKDVQNLKQRLQEVQVRLIRLVYVFLICIVCYFRACMAELHVLMLFHLNLPSSRQLPHKSTCPSYCLK